MRKRDGTIFTVHVILLVVVYSNTGRLIIVTQTLGTTLGTKSELSFDGDLGTVFYTSYIAFGDNTFWRGRVLRETTKKHSVFGPQSHKCATM